MISPFHLHRPTSIEQACSLLSQYGDQAKILAGGSELILLLKMSLASAEHIVDIKGIAGLDRLEFDTGTQILHVGGSVTHTALESSSVVREHFPLLVEMEQQVANIRVRNVGTLGGNLCFAEPHADPGTLLLACDAQIKARSIRRERTLDIADFFVDYYQTALEHDEILTEVEIPKLSRNGSGTYLRFCPGERPIVTVAILIEWSDGVCADARLALGSVGPKPIRAPEIELGLRGKPADEISSGAVEIGEKVALLCDPPPDIHGSVEYKRQIVKTLMSRGLQKLCVRDS
jgi:aerobic carbon-monoxide dehydrogenase medium subunit